jgi:hypothetical protein
MAKVKWPFGEATTLTLSATGNQALTIDNDFTIVDGVTTEATGNRTLNLTIDSEVGVGAMMLIKAKTNGTETTIFGTGMAGATLTGAAGKTKNIFCVYDGTSFKEAATPVQID